MSLSTLGAQLASLHSHSAAASGNGNPNPGSTLGTSRRKEDAVGRGIQHSTQLGHALALAKNAKFKPSVLCDSAAAASDVPLSALQESARSSFQRSLATLCDGRVRLPGNVKEHTSNLNLNLNINLALIQPQSLRAEHERGMLTPAQAQALQKDIDAFLRFLSSVLKESPSRTSNTYTSCLHVYEYLLRRYEIHIYNAQTLVISLLPHYDDGPLFNRVLQLVDLASLQTLTFLRRFALPGAVINRTDLAKAVSRDTALIKQLLEFTQAIASTSTTSTTSHHQHPRGVRCIIATVCAILVQGLTLQANATGTLQEPTVRTIVPFILAAIQSHSDYRAMGHVLCCTLCERVDLTADAVEAITRAILKNRATVDASSLTLLMAILPTTTTPTTTTTTPTRTRILKQIHKRKPLKTFQLPASAFQSLLLLKPDNDKHNNDNNNNNNNDNNVFKLIGQLHSQEGLVVTDLVATLLDMGLLHSEMQFVMQLFRSADMADFWKSNSSAPSLLVASCTVTLLCQAVEKTKHKQQRQQQQQQQQQKDVKTLLKTLQTTHSKAYDEGVAAFLEQYKAKLDKTTKLTLVDLLGIQLPNKTNNQSGSESSLQQQDEQNEQLLLLPPRIALEHANSQIRKSAMAKLASDQPSDGDTVDALLRHFTVEEDSDMIMAAGSAVQQQLQATDGLTKNTNNPSKRRRSALTVESCRSIQKAIVKYSKITRTAEKEMEGALVLALEFGGRALEWMKEQEREGNETMTQQKNSVTVLLLEAFRDDGGVASTAAAKALCRGFSVGTGARDAAATARKLLAGAAGLDLEAASAPALACILRATAQECREETCAPAESARALETVTALLARHASAPLDDAPAFGTCVGIALKHSTDWIPLLAALASIPRDRVYASLAVPSLRAAAKKKTKDVFWQIALQPLLPSNAIIRLLKLIGQQTRDGADDGDACLVPVLALLGHDEYEVRKEMLRLSSKLGTTGLFACIQEAASAILMDGAAALPILLRNAAVAKQDPTLVHLLLKQCVSAVASSMGDAAAMVLNAVELAGESSFSLMDRWSMAGSPILERMLLDASPITSDALLESVIGMLKAAIVHDPTELLGSTVISSGPHKNRSGRARSYSLGRASGASFSSPYPPEMWSALSKCLRAKDGDAESLRVAETVIRRVIASESWRNAVFAGLFLPEQRAAIASELLRASSSTSLSDVAISAFVNLPLDSSDLRTLMEANGSNLASLSVVLDHVRSNASSLAKTKNVSTLVSSLLELLANVSSPNKNTMMEEDMDEGLEYVQHSILLAVLALVKAESKHTAVKSKTSGTNAKLLVSLVSGNSRSHKPLASWKSKKTALSLLATLCDLHPAAVVEHMLEAVLACVGKVNDSESSLGTTLSSVREVLAFAIPVLYQNCSESLKLSMFDVISRFLAEADKMTDDDSLQNVLSSMLFALKETKDENATVCFLSLLTARGIISKTRDKTTARVVALLESVPLPLQAKCILALSAHASQLLDIFLERSVVGGNEWLDQASGFYFLQCKTMDPKQGALLFAKHLCFVLQEAIGFPEMKKFVCKSSDSSLCLQLWQDILLLQSTAADVEGILESEDSMEEDEGCKHLAEMCKQSIEETLSTVQQNLPVPVFLASATSLIVDEANGSLRTRALRFLAERASAIEDASSPEASLFLDLLPQVIDVFEDAKDDEDGMMLQQSAAIVLEQFGRTLARGVTTDQTGFLNALKCCTLRLYGISQKMSVQQNRDMSCQLACSLLLTISTLVRLLQARALPLLPKLIEGLLPFMALVATKRQGKGDDDVEIHSNMIQISVLRAMSSIAQNLPQFLLPHLDKILAPSILPAFTVDDLDLGAILAAKVPSRQLLPAAGRSLKKCTQPPEFDTLLRLTKASVESTPRGEIAAVKGHVLQSILVSTDFDHSLLEAAGDVLVALVMRLSEAQLYPMYAKLVEWRGNDSVARKHAFWTLSSILSKELKVLFLPCLSTVTSDALQQLDYAVSVLSPPQPQKAKKLKVGSVKSLQYLPALISCLGHAFAADAREGGTWIREDGDERYHAFMEPLCKLLQSKVPSDFPIAVTSGGDPFQELIGNGITGCLVSLASAAGNETLWKPLNHSILQACGNDERAQVCRAGLSCLLKLIQTLGEEYMVLLPECLPVLSELLEAEEETAALAREIVDLSENLLGESLEDSLK